MKRTIACLFKCKRLLALGILFTPLSGFAAATESVPTYAQLAFPQADQGTSARAIAMGSAFVGIGGDISSLSWNPAGLAGLPSAQLAFHHNFYLQDLMQDTVAFALPGSLGSWAFSAGYLSYGSLQGRDANGDPTGAYGAGRWAGEIAWAHEFFKGFSVGLGVKGNLMTLGSDSYSNVAGDVGILWDLDRHFHLGASYANWGTDIAANIANSVARFGGAANWNWSPDQKALLAASVSWEPYGATHLNIGAEDLVGSHLALRAGYNWDSAPTDLQGLTGLTAGAGFNLNDLFLDYAYTPFGDLGTSNQVSLTYHFPAPKPRPARNLSQQPLLPTLSVPVLPVTVLVYPTAVPTPVPPAAKDKLKLYFSMPDNGQEAAAASSDPLAAQAQPYQDAIAQNPKNARAWYQLGLLYFQNQRKVDAIQCFEQVLRLEPDNDKLKKWLERYKNQAP